ncbi:protein phosphatase 1 regulatory subunit 26 [Amia ocellicauda]|uniref:protein phosphatase 1 regulatory subunit 26 n=1 Tax=Amia ocellicauda TaxID=2972642 RepID=UPI003464E212
MFLKNVPPVVALHTEWRSYGPARTFSLPMCFNDSDSEISSTGTPIPEKVQMIIDSLRSTQSSLDMSDDFEDSMQPNQARAKCCNGKRGSEMQKVRQRSTMEDVKAENKSTDAVEVETLNSDSDSDDSVDRGIEEAIQEYLKEKSDHGGSSSNNTAQCHKTTNRCSVVTLEQAEKKSESPVQSLHTTKAEVEPIKYPQGVKLSVAKRSRCSSSSSTSSDDSFDQSIHEEIRRFLTEKKEKASEVPAAKKSKLKRKELSNRNSKWKVEPSTGKLPASKQVRKDNPKSDQDKSSDSNKIPDASSHLLQSVKNSQSTSTDKKCGRSEKPAGGNSLPFKKDALSKMSGPKNLTPFETKKATSDLIPNQSQLQIISDHVKEDDVSDSSSDDGIEEAIQRYQLEKQKGKDTSREDSLKLSGPSHSKQLQLNKAGAMSLEPSAAPGTQIIKNQRASSKKKKQESVSKHTVPIPDTSCNSLSRQLEGPEIRGNGFPLLDSTTQLELSAKPALKVNTTAELMCAEAILDISKAVMPPTFDHVVNVTDACVSPRPLPKEDMPYCSENSNNSSVDSDDGIEQEIRKFLEQKAQMHSHPPSTGSLPHGDESSVSPQQNKKMDPSQNKKLRLSLSRKRKHKEEHSVFKVDQTECKVKREPNSVPVTVCDRNDITMANATSRSAEVCDVSDLPVIESAAVKSEEHKSILVNQKDVVYSESPVVGSIHPCQAKNEVSQAWTEGKSQPGDKSSSLDSDEDLDAAIKDLLKTKKKVKKKTRDMKLKAKKIVHFGAVQLCPLDIPEADKYKSLLEQASGANHRTPKSCIAKSSRVIPKQNANDKNVKTKLRRNTSEQLRSERKVKASSQPDHSSAATGQIVTDNLLVSKDEGGTQVVEDSSSVDSDDSIEQEIRRFLAEKAKVSAREEEVKKVTSEISISTCISTALTEVKLKTQQAEISSDTETKHISSLHHSGLSQQTSIINETDQSSTPGFPGRFTQTVDKGPQPTLALVNSFCLLHQADNVGKNEQMHKSSSEKSSFQYERSGVVMHMSTGDLSANADSKLVCKNTTLQVSQDALYSEKSEPFQIKASSPTNIKDIQPENVSDDSISFVCAQQGQDRQLFNAKTYATAEDACRTRCLMSGHESREEGRREESGSLPLESASHSESCAGHSACSLTFPAKVKQLEGDCVYKQGREACGVRLQSTVAERVAHNETDQAVDSEQFTSEGSSVHCKNSTLDQERSEDGEGEIKSQTTGNNSEEYYDESYIESDEERCASKRSDRSEEQPKLSLSSSIDTGLLISPYIVVNSFEKLQKCSAPTRQKPRRNHQTHEKILLRTLAGKNHNLQNITKNKFSISVQTFYKKENNPVRQKKKDKKRSVKRRQLFQKVISKKNNYREIKCGRHRSK